MGTNHYYYSKLFFGLFQSVVFAPLTIAFFQKAFILFTYFNNEMTEIFNLFLGGILGIAPAMTITGYICKYGFAGGWPSAFYLSGEIVPRYIHPGIHRDEIAIIFHFDSV